MREFCEFRIPEDKARRLLRPDEGEVIGLAGVAGLVGVRKLQVETRDPRFAQIGAFDRQLREEEGLGFFSSWELSRKYSKAELDGAELFQLQVRTTVEPEGERCGTEYDDSVACLHCGAGARQLNALRLERSSLPRTRDMVRTIAGSELLFSKRLVDAFHEHGMTGARFHPVLNRGGKGVIDSWFQVELCSRPLEAVSPTLFGNDPFDLDEEGRYRCPQGHVAGLNLLSELWVRRADHDGSDLCATRQLVGPNIEPGGVFRPYPLLLISQRLRRLLVDLKAKRLELEVAHLV